MSVTNKAGNPVMNLQRDVDSFTEEQCEKLTKASKVFGSCDLYIGDDGKIYS